MSCVIEFEQSLIKFEFCSKGNKQKILVDMLIKYGDMNIPSLASMLDITVNKLQDIHNGDDFLVGSLEDDLNQLFLTFFSRTFFKKVTVIRSYCS